VGANGSCKTTLLKMLTDLQGLDYGTVNRQRRMIRDLTRMAFLFPPELRR